MQNITESQRTKEGCFVYHITDDAGIAVRNSPNVGNDNRTKVTYLKNELVSVDLILPSFLSDSNNGPFLRLSDKSGWLFEKKYGQALAEQLPVEKGLWAFYVEDARGTSLRANPTGLRVPYYKTVYQPMQLIYFDRKVVSPVTNIASYRVQGTDGWLPEKEEDGTVILLAENKVKTGLFAYEVASNSMPISVCGTPDDLDTLLPVAFVKGEIITCDVIRQSPNNLFGPFLRLSDGWGWMYEWINNPALAQRMNGLALAQMHPIPIEDGIWTLEVVNSVGISMRRHPVDRQDCMTSTLFGTGDIVRCDKRIKSSGGVTFYRVAGKEGWVFDLRGNQVMTRVTAYAARDSSLSASNNSGGWSIEFVRGMAVAFELTEIMINETSRVISFQTNANERINVYYTTRTVGTALNHPSQGATQLFRRRCSNDELREIMQNPRTHTGKGYKKRSKMDGEHTYDRNRFSGGVEYIDEEADYRNKLLEYEQEGEKIAQKKLLTLKKVKVFDDERAKVALEMKHKKEARTREFEEERRRQQAIEDTQRQVQAQLQRRTCHVCDQVFVNAHAKEQHYQAVHVFRCDYCYKEFGSNNALNQHKNATYHW